MKINDFIPNKRIYSNLGVSNVDTKKNSDNDNPLDSFGETLKNELDNINDKQLNAEKTSEKFVKGENVDVHEVMINTEEAKLSLQLAVQVRNKLMEAYQEINRMQV